VCAPRPGEPRLLRGGRLCVSRLRGVCVCVLEVAWASLEAWVRGELWWKKTGISWRALLEDELLLLLLLVLVLGSHLNS
jgi:hypothetical protein